MERKKQRGIKKKRKKKCKIGIKSIKWCVDKIICEKSNDKVKFKKLNWEKVKRKRRKDTCTQ